MADYTPTTDFSVKDALPVNDPDKLVLGADLDVEFNAIQTAIATKLDISDLATQVQAEAGSNNTTWMSPLRVAQYVAGAAGGGAGIVADLIALADPNADRIIFWDDSAGAAAFLTAGTGLTISGTTITTDDANINHDNLTGFVANEHIDHSGVTLTLQEGLQWSSGGSDLTASATATLDLNGLTAETTLDLTNDFAVFYDASATAHRKIALENLVGAELGDGRWYLSANQAVSTEATVVWNTASHDELTRGTFSTGTGQYTRGSTAGRVHVGAKITIAAMDDDDSIDIHIDVNGSPYSEFNYYNDTDNDTPEQTWFFSDVLNLSATDVVQIRVATSSSESIVGGSTDSCMWIVELS